MLTSSLKEEIWQLVASIPPGKVATYGQIARLAGYPNHSRYVGSTLKNLPTGSKLPWYRVVNGKGQLSFPFNSPSYNHQKAQLEEEGIVFLDHRFSLRQHQWDL